MIASKLEEHVDHVLILKGGMGIKQTRQVREKIESIPENEILIWDMKFIIRGKMSR